MVDLKELGRYSYSGHSALIGKKKRQDVEYVLSFFGIRAAEARKGYESYVKNGIPLGRQKDRVWARDLLCYWAVVELGMPVVDLARKFGITPAAVSYAVQRGEKMAKERGYQLET